MASRASTLRTPTASGAREVAPDRYLAPADCEPFSAVDATRLHSASTPAANPENRVNFLIRSSSSLVSAEDRPRQVHLVGGVIAIVRSAGVKDSSSRG